jgi:serine protease Do
MVIPSFVKNFTTFRYVTTKLSALLLLWGVTTYAVVLPAYAEDAAPVPVPEKVKVAQDLSEAFEQVAEVITPSVVTIATETKAKKQKVPRGMEPFKDFFGDDFFDRMMPGPQRGLGTGVIVDDQGHILTNNHVVGDADEVTVRLSDERTAKAKVVGRDPKTDLAVIKIKLKDKFPKAATLGNSDSLKIGEWVVAAGASFGLENTITAGIVSAKGRAISAAQYEDFIQTDAAINPGNSGGPLVNLHGEVVGINTAIVSKSGGYMGIGFAIPINMVRTVMDSLINKGKVTRGWLGVGIQNLSEDLAKSFNYEGSEGALVGHIDPTGPAKKAGLQQGDIIIEIGSEKIKNVNQLRNFVAGIAPGKETEISVIREGKKISSKVTVGELPNNPVGETTESNGLNEDLGLTVEEYDESSPRRPRSGKTRGLVIVEVDPQGLAARSGLQPGDIVSSVNGKRVDTVDAFRTEIQKGDRKKGIRLVVESQGMERFAFIRDYEESEE